MLVCLVMNGLITHANESHECKTFTRGLSVCTIEPKRLKLQSPNLPLG